MSDLLFLVGAYAAGILATGMIAAATRRDFIGWGAMAFAASPLFAMVLLVTLPNPALDAAMPLHRLLSLVASFASLTIIGIIAMGLA